MRLLVEYRVAHKVLFGSDFPFTTTGNSLAGVRDINAILGQSSLPPVPNDVIESIIQRDTLSLLSLPDPARP
jgi:predicted TIM-barrel fold metal-dependent hydrolase